MGGLRAGRSFWFTESRFGLNLEADLGKVFTARSIALLLSTARWSMRWGYLLATTPNHYMSPSDAGFNSA